MSDDDWSDLVAIAERERLTYGGKPSVSEAIRWLLYRELDRGEGDGKEKGCS